MVHEYNEILRNEYVGDRVDFLANDGLWYERQLRYDESFGLCVKHKGHVYPVTHWGKDSVIRRVRVKR